MSGFGGAELLGWTDDTLALVAELRGWTEDAVERLEVGWDAAEQRVVIPVRDESGSLEPGVESYQPDPAKRNGLPKMLAKNGATRQLFPPPETLPDDRDGWLYLLEGPPDCVRAWSIGLTAVAVPGTQNWRAEWASRFTRRRVVVVLDCDEKAREAAHRIAGDIAGNGIEVRLVDLAPHRDDGFDLTDALRGAGTDPELMRQARRWLTDVAEQTPVYVPAASSSTRTAFVLRDSYEFAALEEPHATPLVATGPERRAVIAAGGTVIVFGADGAGKTTLLVDWAFHFADGVAWLDLLEPTRPLVVALLENEGTRPEFRRKLRDKFAAWERPTLQGRLLVLEQPWGGVTLRDEAHREALAQQLNEHQVGLLFAGPLADLGVTGPGTPADVSDFGEQLGLLRSLCDHPLAIAAAHHENRAGQMSGAWGRLPETVVHVQPQGNGALRIFWHKVRNAGELHKTTTRLAWAEGMTFELVDEPPPRPERTWDDIAAFVLEHGGTAWRPVEQTVPGNGDYLRQRREQMLEEGLLINAGTATRMELWHRDDPARSPIDTSVSGGGHASDTAAVHTGDEGAAGERVRVSLRSRDTQDTDTLAAARPPAPDEETE